MDNNLFKILKELKEIQPDADYSHKSKTLLLSGIGANKKRLSLADVFSSFYSNKLALGIASSVILLLIISGGIYYVKNQLNQNDLVVKASETNASIQVKLNEIQYLLQSHASIDANQILAIQAMLQNSADDLKAALSSKPEELDKSVQKLKAAEEMLYQIDELTKNK